MALISTKKRAGSWVNPIKLFKLLPIRKLRKLLNCEKGISRMSLGKENRRRASRVERVISDCGFFDANIGSDFLMKTNQFNKLEVG